MSPASLAPPSVPAVSSLRSQTAGSMERSFSEDIRDEREELREAAEQTLNVILDLNLDGTIRWVSPSWTEVVGTQPDKVQNTPIADLLVSDNKNVFTEVIEAMRSDDSRSQRVRFAIGLGPLSRLLSHDHIRDPENDGERLPEVADIEAQGIMVYDVTGDESHVRFPESSSSRNALTF